ncbi:rhomboid family intramembrane serine protease [Sulfitobacter sp. S190]|uniref:rhomboid family intramembrane serine protease n=1 Tax=Sulfitobacter sp. S190 TaxID=2867022 RepID=UPI0021A3FF1B|nr:rhomboid family intramembrane serine protease [Sulfitobacter sp. S190]UWR22106.1 rhomboid family intramembrane serine protease [Sulfitobacter sp. S190]
MSDPSFESPINKLPGAVVLLCVAMIGVEAGLSFAEAGIIGGPGAIGWRLGLVRDFGFSGEIFDAMWDTGRWSVDHLLRFVTYPFIHLSFSHSIFAIVLTLALGKMVAEVMGQAVMLAVWLLSGVIGAFFYALLLNDPVWLAGAYPNAYGLIGAYSYVMWRTLGAAGEQQLRAFSLIAMLMGLQLIWSLFASIGNGWVADLAGFFGGFAMCFLLAPGEWRRIVARLRQRG